MGCGWRAACWEGRQGGLPLASPLQTFTQGHSHPSKAPATSLATDGLPLPRPCPGHLPQDLSSLFLRIVPPTEAAPEAVRTLLAHIARTAVVSAQDPGLPVSEVKRALGVAAAPIAGPAGAPAPEPAFAAGWVPGRGRDIFKLLRYHTRKNMAQVDLMFQQAQELDIQQVSVWLWLQGEERGGGGR